MGYNTRFKGSLKLSKPLTEEQQKWYNDWRTIRKQHYDSDKLMEHYKGVGSLDGDYGENGEFFGYIPNEILKNYETNGWNDEYQLWINGRNDMMFPKEHNTPPSNQPSLWNKWKIEGDILSFDDEKEKFYGYNNWLEYIRTKILSKWGITFLDVDSDENILRWIGDDTEDRGEIYYLNNEQKVYYQEY
tara:strand:+ start:281 stop:844 length:564 start_codon:yes stop_codon:yes gene_type:complete